MRVAQSGTQASWLLMNMARCDVTENDNGTRRRAACLRKTASALHDARLKHKKFKVVQIACQSFPHHAAKKERHIGYSIVKVKCSLIYSRS